ncbi:MAG: ABC transporter ATP-binding protein [Gemmiger sp.]|nr:ABC transporter ATP-binding protein [Gemmiger sp.]
MIEYCNVTVGYGASPVLENISFTAPRGKITTLLGLNGCGKTTLLRAAARQLPIGGGDILLAGSSITGYGRKEFARTAAFLPQVRTIPETTVQRLAEHGRFPYLGFSRQMTAADRDAVCRAMDAAGVTAWRARDLRTLSGGERQKAYFAMALAQGSQVLFLDEPTTYLDIAKQYALLGEVQAFAAAGKTILMVLHDLTQAFRYSDYLVVLDGGRLAAAGTPAQLLASGVVERVFGVQLCRTPEHDFYIRSAKG